LSREAQAARGRRDDAAARRLSIVAVVAVVSALVSGCAGGGFGLAKAEADPTILTGAVPPDPERIADPRKFSDEATIRNAISSANLEELNGAALSWANIDTDSRGAITAISEHRDKDVLCRRFTASRESFAGVALYRGEACVGSNGAWWMRSFKEA